MVPPAIEIENICFAFEDNEVLHNISLRIDPGDFVAFVGPNGGGKTTLLRLILGLLQPLHGRIRVFGQDPRAVRQRVGYVPQHLEFDTRFPVTVLDVVIMGRANRQRIGPYRKADRQAARMGLARVRLEDLERRSFAELSGGERQRVLIAQALAGEPDLLLLDEPTANVDTLVEHHIYELLKELSKSLTLVLVSHNLNVVTACVSHVACINRTAELSPVAEMTAATFREAYGSDIAVLRHGVHCHVISPFDALQVPHQGTLEPAGDS